MVENSQTHDGETVEVFASLTEAADTEPGLSSNGYETSIKNPQQNAEPTPNMDSENSEPKDLQVEDGSMYAAPDSPTGVEQSSDRFREEEHGINAGVEDGSVEVSHRDDSIEPVEDEAIKPYQDDSENPEFESTPRTEEDANIDTDSFDVSDIKESHDVQPLHEDDEPEPVETLDANLDATQSDTLSEPGVMEDQNLEEPAYQPDAMESEHAEGRNVDEALDTYEERGYDDEEDNSGSYGGEQHHMLDREEKFSNLPSDVEQSDTVFERESSNPPGEVEQSNTGVEHTIAATEGQSGAYIDYEPSRSPSIVEELEIVTEDTTRNATGGMDDLEIDNEGLKASNDIEQPDSDIQNSMEPRNEKLDDESEPEHKAADEMEQVDDGVGYAKATSEVEQSDAKIENAYSRTSSVADQLDNNVEYGDSKSPSVVEQSGAEIRDDASESSSDMEQSDTESEKERSRVSSDVAGPVTLGSGEYELDFDDQQSPSTYNEEQLLHERERLSYMGDEGEDSYTERSVAVSSKDQSPADMLEMSGRQHGDTDDDMYVRDEDQQEHSEKDAESPRSDQTITPRKLDDTDDVMYGDQPANSESSDDDQSDKSTNSVREAYHHKFEADKGDSDDSRYSPNISDSEEDFRADTPRPEKSTQSGSPETDGRESRGSMQSDEPSGSETSKNSTANSEAGGETSAKLYNVSKKSSRRRSEKITPGTSENPLDITDLIVDSGSLLQLYQNDYFDAYMHMHHLYYRKEAGVHEYLVNLLYSKRTDNEVMFYLPQLCQLSISKYGKSSLHRFLLDKASTSMHFALKLSWFYQAIISDQASKIGHLAQKMTQETEMAVVNSKLISPVSTCLPPTEDRELNLCSKGLLIRRVIIRAIRAGHDSGFNTSTAVEDLERPRLPPQLNNSELVLTCSTSKAKFHTPYAKIGNPLELDMHPYVDCPDSMQFELERLMLKQRRLDYFNMLSNFVKLCMDISKLLTTVSKRDARQPLLALFAKSMNEWMLMQRCTVAAYEESFAYKGLSLPMRKMGRDNRTGIPFQFLRIVEEETKIFLSKKRAPFVFYFEIANLDEDVRQISRSDDRNAITDATFRDLGVYVAIVKDLVSSGLLDVADVSCIQNPLDCIRYTMGMLPPDVLKRYEERKMEFKNGSMDSWRGGDDEDASFLISSVHEMSLGATDEYGENSARGEQSPARSSSVMETKYPLINKMSAREAKAVIFPELLEDKKKRIRQYSPYGKLETWNVRAVIIKGGDDLRQEYMVNQLLTLFQQIFANAQLPLWLRPIEILVTGPNCGIIEFLHDTCSVDVVKRKFNVESIAKAFERIFADNIFEARKNFIESHAAYSVVSYLLQIRDRHNGNILLDSEGHVIHIDYGFCLSNTPGNISFETSPFKLTKEYVDVMGGDTADNFEYFKTLVIRGLLESRKYMDRIVLLVEMMTGAYKMPCFAAGTAYTMDMLRERFMLNLSEDVCIDRIMAMIDESLNNFTTIQYDNFQRLTNGIK
ncbi:phosphatidylinositol 4-kinase [Babesia ovata]|uniref:1-phosphatidylinositol 4-kinase n=1 Tax=Babesia ovata TaxID=189622 RepID=A0A2H6KBV1_9APIC|nr:phosphatidylinositol 4-kinase [Babesia ovata]GBE60439.1 phosphatidylinositol 4-kinase [Babesia ovata]